MALTTVDQLVAATPGQVRHFVKSTFVASGGIPLSLFNVNNYPPAGSLAIGNTTTGLIPVDTDTGFPVLRDAGGSNQLYLARLAFQGSLDGAIVLYDRLWHAGSFALSSLTTLSLTPTALTRETTGQDVEPWLELATGTSNSAVVLTLSYTNQANSSGKTATMEQSLASKTAGWLYPFRLAAGDTGVRSIQSMTVATATNTGTVNLVLMRRVATVAVHAHRPTVLDWLALGLPKLASDSALALYYVAAGSGTGSLAASINVVEG